MQTVFVFNVRRGVIESKYTGLDIQRGQPLSGGAWLKNVLVLLDSNGLVTEYPGSTITTETNRIKTARYRLNETGNVRLNRVMLIYSGNPTVKVKIYNHRFSSTATREITLTDLTSEKWSLLPSSFKGNYVEFDITNFTELKGIFAEIGGA